jgi:hypothetical protein
MNFIKCIIDYFTKQKKPIIKQIENSNKLLFVLKRRENYGVENVKFASGLSNSANFVCNMLNKNGIKADLVEVIDNNCIDKVVTEHKPSHVIIEALWVVPEKFNELSKLHPNVKWIVRIHSNSTFIANEGIAMKWIKECSKLDNVFIAANCEKFDTELSSIIDNDKILYLPNYYEFTQNKEYKRNNNVVINIGCFGAIRPMKNQLIQVMAAIKFANRNDLILHFHMNSDRKEQGGENVYKNISALFDDTRHQIVWHNWQERNEFLELVEKMDICMQVSLTETFNIVAADAVNKNIPIVVSTEIDWIDKRFQCHSTDINDMVNKLNFIYYNINKNNITKQNYQNLIDYNNRTVIAWKRAFGS